MIRRTTKLLLEFIALLAAGLAILVVIAAVKLSSGPLSVGFITPFIESALEPEDGSFDVSLEEVVLTWGGWERSILLRAVGVEVRDGSGEVRAYIPELTIGLSGRALLHGDLAPTSLEIVGPRLTLRRGEDGVVRFTDPPSLAIDGAPAAQSDTQPEQPGEPPPGAAAEEESRPQLAGDFANQVFSDLLAPPGPSNKMGYLTSLSVLDADLVLADQKLNMIWRAPEATFVVLKTPRGLALRGHFGFDVGGETADLSLSAEYDTVDEQIRADLRLADIQPALFAPSFPLVPELAGIKLPVSGDLTLRADFDGTVEEVALDLTGGEGSVTVPGESEGAEGTNVAVRGARLRGNLTQDLTTAELDELTIDFGGPTVAAKGSVQGDARGVIDGPFELAAEVSLRDLPIAELKRLWPATVARNGRRWVMANMSDGLIPEGKFSVRGKAGEAGLDGFEITELSGGFPFKDLSVAYFSPLPPVRKGHGQATVRLDGLSFAVAGGEVETLQVGPGKVDITGLDGTDHRLAVSVGVRGTVRQVLTILDSPRLGYAKALGVKPADIGGETEVQLSVKLPLIDALTFKQIALGAKAKLTGVTMPKAAFDLDLTSGDLDLRLDNKSMDVTGTATLGRTPVTLAWTENFEPKGFARRIKLEASVDDAGRSEMGLDFGAYVQGPVGIDAVMTQNTNRANTVALTADVTPAVLDVGELGWRKEAGVAGKLTADLALTGEKLTAIRKFSLDGDGFAAGGTVNFAGDGKSVSGAKIDKLVYGRSDLALDLARRGDGGFDVTLKGKSFDAAPLLKGDKNGKTPAAAPSKEAPAQPAPPAETEVTPLGITADLGQLYLGSDGGLAQVSLRMERDRKHWRMIKAQGQSAPGKVLRVVLAPDGATRRLEVTSDDAGSVFKALDIFDNMHGGTLRLSGAFDDGKPGEPLAGKLEVQSFRLINAPVMAKLLSVALLTGILDALRGEGIGFDTLDFPFTYVNDVIETKGARAHGSALGITAEGWINLRNDTIGMRGTLVPAYAVNSILNNIPLIGTLLGGPGSGVFAATYRMTGDLGDPDISVNPLATLAPGFLRGLFGIFEGGVPPQQPEALPDPSREKEALPPAPGQSPSRSKD